MNKLAFRTTGLIVKTLLNLSKARLSLHGTEHIPRGPSIFVVNHFTRLETFLFPYVVYTLTKKPVWSLANEALFRGAFGDYLKRVGALSTRAPDRDTLIVRSLLTHAANWIIFPEGRMVKSKKIVEKGKFMVSYAGGKHPPHTGAASLALRSEFYRQRLLALAAAECGEAERLLAAFNLPHIGVVSERQVRIVPVNISYYPLRARENLLSKLAVSLVGTLPDGLQEEMMTEGAMLLSGVDIDIRFGAPIAPAAHLDRPVVDADIVSEEGFGFDDPIRARGPMRREALKVMQRYMAAIYSMTTVNHDHLFAAMLRMMPRRRFGAQAFRKRVYLVASRDFTDVPVYKHKSLEENQVSLITDDRFRKFADFLDVAVEKKAVIPENGGLRRTLPKFTSPKDYHHARISNPVAVMANDVEALKPLQRSLRRAALMPMWRVRRSIVTQLLEREKVRFETAYQRHYQQGVSKSRDIGRPFFLKGRSRAVGVLLLHGYMAAPAEMRPLGDFLGARGFCVYGVRTAGHGTAPEDLARTTCEDWIESVDTGYAILENRCRKVVAVGFSGGGGLALELATRIEILAGVVAVCPPVRIRHPMARMAHGLDSLNKSLHRVNIGAGKSFILNSPENPHINYLKNPVSGVRQLERLMDNVAQKVPRLQVPTLILQSSGDPTVVPEGSMQLAARVGAQDRTYMEVHRDRHGILSGEGAIAVHRTIGAFVERVGRRTPRV